MKFSQLLVVTLLGISCGGAVSAQRSVQPVAPAPTPGAQGARAGQPSATRVNPDAAVLADFKMRVDKYLELRKQAVKDVPPLKETKDPAKIKAAQDGMAVKIRAARVNAKQGDIFTPDIRARFRRLLYPELTGDDGRDAKEIIKDDAPVNITFKVNAKYPDGAPVPTVPANLLVNLPTLPEPLQYRIIDKHLILLDEDADVIVDFMLNIMR